MTQLFDPYYSIEIHPALATTTTTNITTGTPLAYNHCVRFLPVEH